MRKLASAILVVVGVLAAGASPAVAAPIEVIGQFSWDDPGFGIPIFTFENTSSESLANLSLELDTDQGTQSFAFTDALGADTDGDGLEDTFVSSPIIPSGASVQIPDDLSAFIILQAFIRAPGAVLFLLDENVAPLVDATGNPQGLTDVFQSRQVGIEVPEPPPPPPTGVPEPMTVLLVGIGFASVLVQSRRLQPRR